MPPDSHDVDIHILVKPKSCFRQMESGVTSISSLVCNVPHCLGPRLMDPDVCHNTAQHQHLIAKLPVASIFYVPQFLQHGLQMQAAENPGHRKEISHVVLNFGTVAFTSKLLCVHFTRSVSSCPTRPNGDQGPSARGHV